MNSVFREINQIIERDSKDTSYKFALLRGTIDIIQAKSPYIQILGERVRIPIGLMVERWLMYYYPFIESDKFIPQKNGEKDKPGVRLAFRPHFKKITEYYVGRGGFSSFFHDLHVKGIPEGVRKEFLALARKISETIVRMPMKYIGYSVFSEYFSLYTPYKIKYKAPKGTVELSSIINIYGTFTIPLDYYEVFTFLGSYISGMEGLLMQWADFTVNVSKKELSRERALDYLLTLPVHERDIHPTAKFYKAFQLGQDGLYCVWTQKKLIKHFEVDHLIPFSVWRNNNLWNLLPASRKANNQKRDKIPSVPLLERQKDQILYYWTRLFNDYPDRFSRELTFSLLGETAIKEDWPSMAFESLVNNCIYLSEERGYEIWDGLQ